MNTIDEEIERSQAKRIHDIREYGIKPLEKIIEECQKEIEDFEKTIKDISGENDDDEYLIGYSCTIIDGLYKGQTGMTYGTPDNKYVTVWLRDGREIYEKTSNIKYEHSFVSDKKV